MQSVVAFHNVDHSDALVDFIEKKSKNLSKFLWKSEHFSWVIEHDSKQFRPILKFKLNNKMVSISALNQNVFKAVNEVIEKAKRLVAKSHKKLNNSH